MLNLEKSSQAFAQAKEVMPGGVNSPVRSFARVKCDPPFIAKASGSKIYDIDGNEYIDYVSLLLFCICLNKLPNIGISPKKGILLICFASSLPIKPPITIV